MKTIGLLAGMSWESSVLYYQGLNRGIQSKLGGLNSASMLMHSVNFAPLEAAMIGDDWAWIGQELVKHAQNLEQAGAECLVIATNTMHRFAPLIQSRIDIPLLHIVDAIIEQMQDNGQTRAGLLGTRFSMEAAWYKERLAAAGIGLQVPDQEAREWLNAVIFDELCLGTINPKSRDGYVQHIQHLSDGGAEVVLLGCTEIALLVSQQHTQVPLLDTTACHIDAVVRWVLAQ